MQQRNNAILLFSKVPQPGKVKTRLTVLKDGFLAPEWASNLYHCMLFDVVECCCACAERLEARCAEGGVQDVYDIIISCPGEAQEQAMCELFEASGSWPRPIRFIQDNGATFDEHYNDAFSQAWALGYDTVLSMGCDMPALTQDILETAFRYLHRLCQRDGGGIVLSPDQEMGVSIVGWTRDTAFDHSGVYYCQNGLTVLPAYVDKARRQGLPVHYLPAMPDVDTWADLRHNITLMQAIEYAAGFQDDLTVPHRTLAALAELGLVDVRVMPNDLMDPRDEIDL